VAATGAPYTDIFTDIDGNPVPFDPGYPNDSYFLLTNAKDRQLAAYGEGTFSFTDEFKLTLGARSRNQIYHFTSLTGGPQLFNATTSVGADKSENSFTPKVSFSYQMDRELYYFTYAKAIPSGRRQQIRAYAAWRRLHQLGISGAPLTSTRYGQQLRGSERRTFQQPGKNCQ